MYRLRNYGNSRNFPIGKEGIFIAAQSFIDIEDPKMATALSKMPMVGLEILESKKKVLKGK
jgi:hypothetical protein